MEELALDRKPEEVRALLWHLIEYDVEQNRSSETDGTETCLYGVAKKWEDLVKALPAGTPLESKGKVLAIVSCAKEKDSLRAVLQSAGYELDCLDSGEEALKRLHSEHTYTAILCDYLTSSHTVWRLHKQIHDQGFHIPLIAMGVCDDQKARYLRELDPSLPHLRKPFTSAQFETALTTANS